MLQLSTGKNNKSSTHAVVNSTKTRWGGKLPGGHLASQEAENDFFIEVVPKDIHNKERHFKSHRMD